MGMYGSKIGTPIIRWLIVNAKDILQSVVPYGLNFDSYYIYYIYIYMGTKTETCGFSVKRLLMMNIVRAGNWASDWSLGGCRGPPDLMENSMKS